MSDCGQGSPRGLRSLVVAGGGVAGWMAAAALARVLGPSACEITVVESETADAAGVGEGTLPHLRAFHGLLEVDERAFLGATQATFKLGTRFHDWGTPGRTFLHPFGPYGIDVTHELFQAYWLKRRQEGQPSPLEEWSVTGWAATLGRFGQRLSYAYHLDETLYARFLRTVAQKRGARRVAGEVIDATIDGRGLIESLRLRDGRSIGADFFIDCSAGALLIEGALGSGWLDWSPWLPCDRTVAAPCAGSRDPAPVTQSTARKAGWQWRIPLQHRVGNGYVYCSAHLSDDEAASRLLESLEGPPLANPRLLRLRAGCRKKAWVGNCLALGPAAVASEPLEPTDIHLTQTGLGRLFCLFPDRDFDPASSAEYNRLTALEHEHVRDFLIQHCPASGAGGASLPDSLLYRRDLFARTGRIARLEGETFAPSDWLAIYTGLGLWPQRHEPVIDLLGAAAVVGRLDTMRAAIRKAVETLPTHASRLQEVTGLG